MENSIFTDMEAAKKRIAEKRAARKALIDSGMSPEQARAAIYGEKQYCDTRVSVLITAENVGKIEKSNLTYQEAVNAALEMYFAQKG
jgi:hypothetical protein